jgi:hypothetical protein
VNAVSHHNDWLSLVDVSGPFLAEPVLRDVFPQGFAGLDPAHRRDLRSAYDEWREAVDLKDTDLQALHRAWIELVLSRVLEWDADVLKSGEAIPSALSAARPELGIVLRPDYAAVSSNGDKPLCLVTVYAPDQDLGAPIKAGGWAATPADRMVELCRGAGVRLGLVTNGEAWMLVDAPIGGVVSFATWYGRVWLHEPVTLQAFVDLLNLRRFHAEEGAQLPILLARSLEHQDEVTDALGEQVRRAIEVLIQSLDRADLDRKRELLRGLALRDVYEAALTVMMRIVFLLSAEERGLLLMGDGRYEAGYAVSTLRRQLRSESDEILERRFDAWARLLAIFRVVYAGVDHDDMRLPALGGSLFDPDRYPFLEGRAAGTRWTNTAASPLPIDNRTVLLILDAVQLFQGRTLSYRALDVEQIGHVYEGLLERTVTRAPTVTLDLAATKNARNPWVTLPELDDAHERGRAAVEALLKERMGSSAGRVRNNLDRSVDASASEKLLTACQGDIALRDRLQPYYHLLRTDRWGYPLVYPKGAYMVASGSDRRETGAHYTPKSLTEVIVKETLEPLVYIGPAEGSPKDAWRLRTPGELLDLKICDPAMGSGAFLVQVCRYMAERLVEAWDRAEATGKAITAAGVVVDALEGAEPLRRDLDERLVVASRMVAERCLYGVDMNPLAVELAKLSIWLVTLAKGRPFGFLDHNLRCGDSLLGITSIGQLRFLEIKPAPSSTLKLFATQIDKALADALNLRIQMRSEPVLDIRDIQAMARLDAEARSSLALVESAADALIGEVIASGGKSLDVTSLSIDIGEALAGSHDNLVALRRVAYKGLNTDLPDGKPMRRPHHWPLAFPEVFSEKRGGFDALVGNPPFLGGKLVSGAAGAAYQGYLVKHVTMNKPASVDMVVHFFIRTFDILRPDGCAGLLGRRSMNEAKNCDVGFRQLIENGASFFLANTDLEWPGRAAVVVHQVHWRKGAWNGTRRLNGCVVPLITADLSEQERIVPEKLPRNQKRMYQGSILSGEGFKIDAETAQSMLSADAGYRDVVFPYMVGDDITSDARPQPKCWAICFWDWNKDRASRLSAAWDIVLERVYAERQKKKANGEFKYRSPLPERWWQYGEKRPGLYSAIGRSHVFSAAAGGRGGKTSTRVLAASTASTKYPAFTWLPSDRVFSNTLCVLSDERDEMFAALSSDIHGVWAWKQRTTKQNNMQSMRYAHGMIFETFPFPEELLIKGDDDLARLGGDFFRGRQAWMEMRGYGLTGFYNEFHSPAAQASEVVELRRAQSDINRALAKLYGWNDVDLTCDFHEVGYLPKGSNTRCTISEQARAEVLSRLSRLNGAQSLADKASGLDVSEDDDDDDDDEDEIDAAEVGQDLLSGLSKNLQKGGRR